MLLCAAFLITHPWFPVLRNIVITFYRTWLYYLKQTNSTPLCLYPCRLFSWVLWEADTKMESGVQEVFLEGSTCERWKGREIVLEREDSDASAELTESQSAQQRARKQRPVITWVLHGKEWQGPPSLPCSVPGWSYPGKMACPQSWGRFFRS